MLLVRVVGVQGESGGVGGEVNVTVVNKSDRIKDCVEADKQTVSFPTDLD